MRPALYVGQISHQRFVPRSHSFSYPFFMWFLNLDELDKLPHLGNWFSHTVFALSRFYRPDYFGDKNKPLADAIRERMIELTGYPVEGVVCGLMNMRTVGLYFSPVNFYYGYDKKGDLTHFLAEVSNIPWNERHQYGHYLKGKKLSPDNPKAFHVSPFNPVEQHYNWQIGKPEENVLVQIDVDDDRGKVFSARLELDRRPLNKQTVRKALLRRPVMTLSVVVSIYWQALKLYTKGVPYVPYKKETV